MESQHVPLNRDPVLWLGVACAVGFSISFLRDTDITGGFGLAGMLLSAALLFACSRQSAVWCLHLGLTLVLMAATGTVDGIALTAFASALGILGGLCSPGSSMSHQSDAPPLAIEEPIAQMTQKLSVLEIDSLDVNDEEELERDAGTLCQHWERRRLDDGTESFSALLRVQFQPGERVRLEHLPVHPPIDLPEELWLEVIEGNNITAEQDLLKPYGFRITVRRRGDLNSAADALISVSGSSARQSRAA